MNVEVSTTSALAAKNQKPTGPTGIFLVLPISQSLPGHRSVKTERTVADIMKIIPQGSPSA